jgi:glycosyltransferase involved in cell wall biosynthesis
MDKLMVSVVMITYGHEKYLKQAIEGVFMQVTNFEIELIISNDCSPDNSQIIITDLLSNYKGNVKVNYTNHLINIGAISNFNYSVNQCVGKYIAICEGDDYWTDPLKLQKQVDFLEANPTYGLVCTNYTSDETTTTFDNNKEITLKDILKDSAIGTVTSMFKNSLIIKYLNSNINLHLSMGDFPLWIHIASIQKVYKLADITAHYRILENSATGRNDVTKRIKFALDVLMIVLENLNKIPNKNDQYSILHERYGQLFKVLIEAKDKRFIKYQWEYFKLVEAFKMLDIKILFFGISKIYF